MGYLFGTGPTAASLGSSARLARANASHAGHKEFDHPVVGRMLFESVTLRQEGSPPLWVMFKVPVTEANTPVKLSKLLAQSAAKDSVRKRSVQRKLPKRSHQLQKRAPRQKPSDKYSEDNLWHLDAQTIP